jgi:predicted aspartyl protease
MIEELKLAMQIIATGVHHTSVDLLVEALDNKAPIANATVIDNKNDKTYTTDEEGYVHIANHGSGHFTFTISANGKQTLVFATDIKRGSANAFTVKLAGV